MINWRYHHEMSSGETIDHALRICMEDFAAWYRREFGNLSPVGQISHAVIGEPGNYRVSLVYAWHEQP